MGWMTVCDRRDSRKGRHYNFISMGSCWRLCKYSAFKCLWEVPKRQPVLSFEAFALHLQPVPSIFALTLFLCAFLERLVFGLETCTR